MLVLTRKQEESIVIAGTIEVTVLEVKGNRVRLGIKAPADVLIRRAEIELHSEELGRCVGFHSPAGAACVPA